MISLTVLITSTLRREDHRGSSIFLDKSGRFQNLQLEFSPQKSEFCAFQNLQLEFFPQTKIQVLCISKFETRVFYSKNPSCIFRFKPDGFLVRVTVKSRTSPEHPEDTPEYPGITPDGPNPPEHP